MVINNFNYHSSKCKQSIIFCQIYNHTLTTTNILQGTLCVTYNLFTVTHDLCPVTVVVWPLTSVLHNPGLGDGWVGHGVGQGPHVLGKLLKLLPLLALDCRLKRVQVLEIFEFGLHCLNLGPQQHDLLVLLLNLNTSSLGNISHTKISLEQCWSWVSFR